jgi:hypothetical protein
VCVRGLLLVWVSGRLVVLRITPLSQLRLAHAGPLAQSGVSPFRFGLGALFW